jgi:TM2 domain-containing membrane protein YozV
MKHSIKAALLSGLFFPGTGQIALKHYKRGIALLLTVSVCVFYIVKQAVNQAFSILDQFSQSGTVDMNAITHAATQVSGASDSTLVNVAYLVITGCWLFGIIDAYVIGKSMDNKINAAS